MPLHHTDSRRITGKRFGTESVDLNHARGHGSNYVMPNQVRRAELADLDTAWAIVSEYYEAVGVQVREDPQSFRRQFFEKGSGVWLASLDSAVVGCIALRPLDGAKGEVKRLYVQPAHRGLGIAGLLLDALHTYAQAAGYQWLYLDSKDDLKAARAFYEKRGYSTCARYNDNPQATIFMRKPLP
jgi:GNAT superfamily N-acetyltransferase